MRLIHSILVALIVAPLSSALAQQDKGEIEVETLEGRKSITPDWRNINANPLGDQLNPVRVHRPAGQRAYLSRLVCPEGGAPAFSRIGSFGRGPYGTIVDAYTVTCVNSAKRVFMDMYHPDYVESRTVPGFTIRAP